MTDTDSYLKTIWTKLANSQGTQKERDKEKEEEQLKVIIACSAINKGYDKHTIYWDDDLPTLQMFIYKTGVFKTNREYGVEVYLRIGGYVYLFHDKISEQMFYRIEDNAFRKMIQYVPEGEYRDIVLDKIYETHHEIVLESL